MRKRVAFRLSILLTAQVFPAGILAMPGWNYAINFASGHIVSDDFKKSTTSTSSHAVVVTETVTTVETVIVGTVTVPDTLDSSSVVAATSDITTDDQLETVTITQAAEPEMGTPGTDAVSAIFTDKTSQTIRPVTPPQYAGSVSTPLPDAGANNTTTTSTATITLEPPSSPSAFTSDDPICDDVFCNTDGNKVCIYWGGITSWDVSLGPLPGERPTVIGTC